MVEFRKCFSNFRNLNVFKAAGPDSLRPIVFKELGQVIAPVISIIFQVPLNSGTVPSDRKKAQVCPHFKKGDKTDLANYCPISLTCILCKTMEHIIASNLMQICSLCASVYMCFVVTCWERADLLALVCGVCCEFVTFPLVSWVRCGT